MSNIVNIRNKIQQHFNDKREEYLTRRKLNARRKWGKYYHTPQWQSLREWKFLNNPCCEMHAKYGIIVPTDCVHHKKPFSTGVTEDEKWRLLLNPNNLVSVCDSCHAEFHRQLKEKNLDYLDEIVPVDIQAKNI